MEVLTAGRDRDRPDWPRERGGKPFGSQARAAPLRIAMLAPVWISVSASGSGGAHPRARPATSVGAA